MKKKYIISIVLIFTFICIVINNSAYAEPVYDRSWEVLSSLAETNTKGLDGILESADNFIKKGETDQTNTINSKELNEGINLMYNIFVGAGVFIASIVGVILGIKFMSSASSEEKAKYKQAVVVYVVGCVIIFGAFGIWKIVVDALNGVS